MILLIDNYDSFSYNLYQLAGAVAPEIQVIRNDAYTVEEIEAMQPEAIIISPGPGRPADAGICVELVQKLAGKMPILGVCLGHQAICEAFGATVSYAKELMHGKQSLIETEPDSVLFQGIGSDNDPAEKAGNTSEKNSYPIKVARYHSLAALKETLPKELRVTARTADGEVMAVEHTEYPVYGVQFHPESVMTPDGLQMMKNFVGQIKQIQK